MDNKKLEEQIVQEKRKYFREWRAKNKERIQKSNEKYWQKRAEKRIKESEKNEQYANNVDN